MLAAVLRTYREAYSDLPRTAWWLAAAVFVNRAGTMVLFFMTLYLTQRLGYSIGQAGQVMSAFGLGSLVGTYFGGRLSDVLGAYTVQKLSLLTSGVLLIALSYPRSLTAIAMLMLLGAAASEALHPANSTAIAQIFTEKTRAKGYSLTRLAANLGFSIGPLLGGYLALVSYRALFWVDGLTSLAAAGLVFAVFRTAGPHGEGRPAQIGTPRNPWADLPFLAFAGLVFLVGLVFAQFFSTFPLYAHDVYGFRENRIGQLVAVNTLIIVSVEMLVIHALRGRPPALVASVGALILCGGFALMPFGRGFAYAALTVAVWTMGEILTSPTLSTIAANRADAASQGRYQGLFSVAFALAMTVGPTLGSRVYAQVGPDVLWYGVGLLGLVISAGLSGVHRLMRTPAVQSP
jgi:predicted MFS family arabinose efflux permease